MITTYFQWPEHAVGRIATGDSYWPNYTGQIQRMHSFLTALPYPRVQLPLSTLNTIFAKQMFSQCLVCFVVKNLGSPSIHRIQLYFVLSSARKMSSQHGYSCMTVSLGVKCQIEIS